MTTFSPDVDPTDLHVFADALSEDDPDAAYCHALEVQELLGIGAWGPAYRAALLLVSSLAQLSRATSAGRVYFCEAKEKSDT